MLESRPMKYWFKPKRFWNWFAFYYPTSLAGWLATVFLLTVFVRLFFIVDARSHSASDTLINFAPYAIAIFLLFDFLCFRFGEYPSWWRKAKRE